MTDIHALVGAYVLDAVNDVERAAFARHLAGCDTCAVEVAELRETAARLAEPTWSVPPPGMRAEVLDRVRRTRQLLPGRADPEGSPALSRWRRWTAAAVAAGILAAGAGALGYSLQEQRVREQRGVAEAARAEADRIRSVLAAPDAVLHGGAVTGGGRISLVTSESLDAGVVLLGGAPAPGPDRAYQLWLLRGGQPADAGVLTADASSAARLITGVRGADGLGLTVEPAAGSARPTLPTVAEVPIT
ncbi:anti-sigma factor [Micromonospora sp. WMMD1102]|uniref:anti-sigma factor n=1 Tax=Micromonospora sp. WMMD1102 TaxID=3016105 RepID=UPI0024158B9D|nr:anti-sigma factor [Micromonospora sp. WMMD1102]MDG4784785.1 anti-sigma factor [Micromonospora sp. WMMD1102]